MKTKYLATCITLIFIVFSMAFTHAQDSWAVKLPIKGYPKKMIQAPDGGYILIAEFNYDTATYDEIEIFKYSEHGVLEWFKTLSLGDSANHSLKDIAVTDDKGISVVGYVISPPHTSAKAFIFKIDAIKNDLSWADTLRFSNQSSSYSEVEPTSNNELLAIGGGSYTLLHRYDENGQLTFTYKQDTFAGTSAHFLRTSDNKFFFVNPLAGKLHVFLTNTDAQHLVDKYYTGIAADQLAEIPGQGFLLLGNGVTKLNSGLDSLWYQPADTYKRWGFTGQVNRDISPASDGGFVICGKLTNSLTEEAFMLKADAQGNKLWDKVYFQSVVWDAVSIIGQPDGGNVMFMEGRRSVGVVPDMWLVKTTPEGEVAIEETGDFNRFSAKVYPNPSSGNFFIFFSSPFTGQVGLYDLQGKKVHQQFASNSLQEDIYAPGLAPGMYILVANEIANEKSFQQKLLIK